MLRRFEILSRFLSETQKAARICFNVLKTTQDFDPGLKSDQDMLQRLEILFRILFEAQKATTICFDILKYCSGFYPRFKK